jgi:hypothetical protein
MTRGGRTMRKGFALPLALFMLTVVALLAAALLQGSVDELRIARGEVAAARAEAASESALAGLLGTAPDSTILALPPGTTVPGLVAAAAETTHVVIQILGTGLVRVAASAVSWSGGLRADATEVAFMRVVADPSGTPGSLRYERLPGWWWVRNP